MLSNKSYICIAIRKFFMEYDLNRQVALCDIIKLLMDVVFLYIVPSVYRISTGLGGCDFLHICIRCYRSLIISISIIIESAPLMQNKSIPIFVFFFLQVYNALPSIGYPLHKFFRAKYLPSEDDRDQSYICD